MGKTVKAKAGHESHAGKATGKVTASSEYGPEMDTPILWSVEWDKGPPWRGWYMEHELEVDPNA